MGIFVVFMGLKGYLRDIYEDGDLEDSKGYLTVFKGCLVTLKGFLWF
jgi:hypothetical protein